jgi:hypothetical protein
MMRTGASLQDKAKNRLWFHPDAMHAVIAPYRPFSFRHAAKSTSVCSSVAG